jgi:hypothetical protein
MQMWFKTIFILLLVSILATGFAFGQKTSDKKDTKELYEDFESKSGKSKFTKFMHHLFFKPVAPGLKKKKTYKKLIQKPYSTFEGKVIRHISIITLDPFGYSIADTTAAPRNFISKAGNSLHLQSRPVAIRNLLLVRQNQLFDSLLVKESERLVRSQKYVRDVSFFVSTTSKNSDSVDIFIRELDTWSLIPKGTVSTTRVSFSLSDRNFLGLGHETREGFNWNHKTGAFAYNLNYFIPNIRNTFINSTLHYGVDEFGDFASIFAVDRPFFSPLTKWAAGVNFMQILRQDYIRASDSVLLLQRFKLNSQDFWAGYAINVLKGLSVHHRTTNLITAARFLRVRYLEKPIELYDLQHTFADEDLYLASIGLSTRKYVQDKYIFRFGVPEDIPIGKVFSLTGGYQEKNNTSRVYAGARISFGYYYPWGYLSANFEYGSFFRASHQEQGVFSANIIYFTGLVEIGKWKFRQFVKPQVIIGLNSFAFDSLTLNDGHGLNGFKSTELKGTSRLLLTLQTQSYAPWDFIGFRFGPFINCSLGILGDEANGFKDRKVYAQIGLGILIKNDYLVFNTFQLSISFYPIMPGGEHGVFKFNSFRTTDFGFGDFDVEKPAIVGFQ